MSQNDMFRTPNEEAGQLAQELRELKDVLREISRKVGQIEGRVKRAFPGSFPSSQARSVRKEPLKLSDPPTLTAQGALELYDELVRTAKEGRREDVQHRLETLALPDLALLSRELGVALGKAKPSRNTLRNAVLGRINESLMLSASTLRERPERQAGNSKESKSEGAPANLPPTAPSSEPTSGE